MFIFLCLKVSPGETKFDMSKVHESNLTVPYTVLVGKIDLHKQPLVVQLQKYPNTFLLVFFVSPQIVQNVVSLAHFFQHVPHVENTFKYIKTYTHVLCVWINGKLVLLLDQTDYV